MNIEIGEKSHVRQRPRRRGDPIRDLAEQKHLLLYRKLHLRIVHLVNRPLNTPAQSHPAGGTPGSASTHGCSRALCSDVDEKTIKAGIQEAAS